MILVHIPKENDAGSLSVLLTLLATDITTKLKVHPGTIDIFNSENVLLLTLCEPDPHTSTSCNKRSQMFELSIMGKHALSLTEQA